MANLRWHWNTCDIGSATIADVYNAIATNASYGLPSLGCTDIEAGTDVHGSKGASIIAVLLLPITGSQCWLVVSCCGADAKTNVDSAVGQIGILIEDSF